MHPGRNLVRLARQTVKGKNIHKYIVHTFKSITVSWKHVDFESRNSPWKLPTAITIELFKIPEGLTYLKHLLFSWITRRLKFQSWYELVRYHECLLHRSPNKNLDNLHFAATHTFLVVNVGFIALSKSLTSANFGFFCSLSPRTTSVCKAYPQTSDHIFIINFKY